MPTEAKQLGDLESERGGEKKEQGAREREHPDTRAQEGKGRMKEKKQGCCCSLKSVVVLPN